jgi:hypothetical protein
LLQPFLRGWLLLDTQEERKKQVAAQVQMIPVVKIARYSWTTTYATHLLQEIHQRWRYSVSNS